ncbi:MAG: hypothetical protein KKH70_20520 [Gammaproteobacteria bacterium]|nr:hypothetical protein [Gammaproteobacteria bacterium]
MTENLFYIKEGNLVTGDDVYVIFGPGKNPTTGAIEIRQLRVFNRPAEKEEAETALKYFQEKEKRVDDK